MSQEVEPFLVGDKVWLPLVSAALWDNRFLCTCGYQNGAFGGLISWDVGASYYNGVAAPGVYDGLWTGVGIEQLVSATIEYDDKLLLISKSNKIYILNDTAVLDPNSTPIKSRIETRSFIMGDFVTTKKLNHVELWLSDIKATTDVSVYYRPHGYPLWKKLGDTRTADMSLGGLPQSRARMRFSVDFSSENCNPITQEPLYLAQAFQVAIEWTGRATIDRMRIAAEPLGEQPPDPCDDTGKVIEASDAAGVAFSDYDYTFTE
jgi:hypothetical protein